MFLPGKEPGEREENMSTELVLSNTERISLEDGSCLGNMRVLSPDKASMIKTWDKFSDSNLKTAQMYVDGSIVGNFADLTCDGESSTQLQDGSILTEFHLREKTDIEKLQELVAAQSAEIEALKEGQGVQDGAIDDLGVVTSTLVEKVEGGQV